MSGNESQPNSLPNSFTEPSSTLSCWMNDTNPIFESLPSGSSVGDTLSPLPPCNPTLHKSESLSTFASALESEKGSHIRPSQRVAHDLSERKMRCWNNPSNLTELTGIKGMGNMQADETSDTKRRPKRNTSSVELRLHSLDDNFGRISSLPFPSSSSLAPSQGLEVAAVSEKEITPSSYPVDGHLSKRLVWLHVTVCVALIVFIICLAVTSFLLLRQRELASFDSAFQNAAKHVTQMVGESLRGRVLAAKTAATLYRFVVQNKFAGVVPNITMPGVETVLADLTRLSSSHSLALLPVLTPSTRKGWETYASSNFLLLHPSRVPDYLSSIPWTVTGGIFSESRPGVLVYSPGYLSGSIYPQVVTPVWQIWVECPEPFCSSYSTSVADTIMFDRHAGDTRAEAIDCALSSLEVCMSDVTVRIEDVPEHQSVWELQLYAPVVMNAERNGSVVALAALTVSWAQLLANSLPTGTSSMECKVSGKYHSFTLGLYGERVRVVDAGTTDTTHGHSREITANLESLANISLSHYSIRLYSTVEMYDEYVTDTPGLISGIFVLVVGLTAAIVWTYGYFVRATEMRWKRGIPDSLNTIKMHGGEDDEGMMNTEQLPRVHSLLLQREDECVEREILIMLRLDADIVDQTDCRGNTALDLIFKKRNKAPVTADLVFQLLLLSINRHPGEPVVEISPKNPWFKAVQLNDDYVVEAVQRVLIVLREDVTVLADATDTHGRSCKYIAGQRCKEAIFKRLYLDERYELKDGPPLHMSACSQVLLAIDHMDGALKEGLIVAIKFMRFSDQFRRESESRRVGCFDSKFVIPILETYDGVSHTEANKRFREDALIKGFEEYPFCIVMEAANESLKGEIDHQHIAGVYTHEVKHMSRQLIYCLDHVHSKGVTHGDLKPLNVLQVGINLKLTDFDAASSFVLHESIPDKCSSGYMCPEAIWIDCDSDEVGVRSPKGVKTAGEKKVEILESNPAQDIWALGCIIYMLCTGSTLFHCNVEDNIIFKNDWRELYTWEDSVKERKLREVKDKYARNIISIMLNKVASKRPRAKALLSHPFFTGRVFSRMQGEEAAWDLFLSYRVDSDLKHAEMIYDKLVNKGMKVWWDKKCLSPGQNWEEGFCSGLINSANIVCLVSRNSINSPSNDTHNFGKFSAKSAPDNLLLEWRLSLELKERGMITGIYPVLIGDELSEGIYDNYFNAGCKPDAVDVTVESVEVRLREHLNREGLGMSFKEALTVQELLQFILVNQGGFIEGSLAGSLESISCVITEMVYKSRVS